MKKFFIKRVITGKPPEYYHPQDGWTTDRSQAAGWTMRVGAEVAMRRDGLETEGAYISTEEVFTNKEQEDEN